MLVLLLGPEDVVESGELTLFDKNEERRQTSLSGSPGDGIYQGMEYDSGPKVKYLVRKFMAVQPKKFAQ